MSSLRKVRRIGVVIAGVALISAAHASPHQGGPPGGSPSKVAARAIAYARAQIGRPYLWGGTGPDAFDCSGLAMMAYRNAGISIERTSQAQWATERHVSSPAPGDLVFYAGADGTQKSPGHVAIVVGGGDMIEAYATGYPVREVPVRPGAVGFTDPAAPGGA